jgi:acyl-coenzyme A thioesterase PaaI-like protein
VAAGPHPWSDGRRPSTHGGSEFGRLIDNLRVLQDRVTAARPPADVISAVADQLAAAAELLARYGVAEPDQVTGHRPDLPGRGQTMAPVFLVDEWDAEHASGRVTFGRFYLGGNGAVHGGAIPLLFDDVIGRLANTGRSVARTAYLHVDFRSVTPIEKPLRLRARFYREEGRKRFIHATLHDGDRLCAEADGLFVMLRPGQQ